MTVGKPFLPLPHNPDPECLAQGVLRALREERLGDAVPLALLLVGRFGVLHPEVHALCATVLSRAGYEEESLSQWDAAVRRQPQRTDWLGRALRAAWKLEDVSERAAAFAHHWQMLLERIFIAAPSPDLLAELSGRGWRGSGAAGMHQGRLRAWLWLPEQASFRVGVSTGGPRFSLGAVRRLTLASHTLHLIDASVPEADVPFFLHITDADGHHIQGSPISCSSTRCALPQRSVAVRKTKQPQGVTVIVPVYGDRKATLACLASVIASRRFNKTPSTILVMWDHGPDRTLLDALMRLAKRDKILFRETPVNIGFLACVNQALACVPTGDVILLNADTLVHGDWIDRMAAVARRSDAGTVTALGSDAELVSFPSPSERGDVRRLRQVRILDDACRQLSEQDAVREIPVGVGFCMAIARRALDRLGGFDGFRLFGGYGEEVDFCLRVKEAGLKNYAAMHVFVAHLGGRSFGYAKKALAAQNNVALFARYPRYDAAYKTFQLEDPLRGIRETISRNACRRVPSETVLHVYPWTAAEHPVVRVARENAVELGDAWAALFVLPCDVFSSVMLRVCHDVPLADMSFTLPRDADALRDTIGRCRFRAVRLHCPSAAVRGVTGYLGLPEENLPQTFPPALPRFQSSGGAYLVEPPRTIHGWKRLCRTAAEHPDTVFWVCGLETCCGDAPRPANVRFLPDLDDMTPLSPCALVLLEAADAAAVAAWRQWLERHVRTSVPVCVFSEEAA